MGFLITDPTGIRIALRKEKRMDPIPLSFPAPCQPCAAVGLLAFACAQTRECVCLRRRDYAIISRMPCVPGVTELRFSPCGRYLYQLSAEADCIHTRATATGELLFAAPAGVFPRMMSLQGGRMLVAGGAVGEACLYSLPELFKIRTIETRHPCFAAAQWKEGLVLVCAAEGEDIHTVVYTLPPRALRPRKLVELPGMPGTICICPDSEHALMSTGDGLMKLHLPKAEIVWNCPEWALSMRLCCRENHMLVSDTLSGGVWLADHCRPWEREKIFQGSQAQACFLEPV